MKSFGKINEVRCLNNIRKGAVVRSTRKGAVNLNCVDNAHSWVNVEWTIPDEREGGVRGGA